MYVIVTLPSSSPYKILYPFIKAAQVPVKGAILSWLLHESHWQSLKLWFLWCFSAWNSCSAYGEIWNSHCQYISCPQQFSDLQLKTVFVFMLPSLKKTVKFEYEGVYIFRKCYFNWWGERTEARCLCLNLTLRCLTQGPSFPPNKHWRGVSRSKFLR